MKKARTGMTDFKFEVFVYYPEVCYHFSKNCGCERGKENIIIELIEARQLVQTSFYFLNHK